MVPRFAAALLVSAICVDILYHVRGDERASSSDVGADGDDWRSEQDASFRASGICEQENRSAVGTCDFSEDVKTLYILQRTQCHCDEACHVYHDCCIDKAHVDDKYGRKWACAQTKGKDGNKIPFYVYQKCPHDWDGHYVRSLCETESELMGDKSSYMQDVPVYSKRWRIFYRNVFCALCNRDANLVRWESYFHCNGDSANPRKGTLVDNIDFSEAVYDARKKSFQRSKVDGRYKNCRIVIKDFELTNLFDQYNARLCKPAVDTCPPGSNESVQKQCESYTSYVYEMTSPKVYKNFNCALCNNANISRLQCVDPYYPSPFTGPTESTGKVLLTYLFDFNFAGGSDNVLGVISPCLIRDGQIWDPIKMVCSEFTCGALFERKGSKCIPRITDGKVSGINSTCLKRILLSDAFAITENGSAFLNASETFLNSSEYEVYERSNGKISSIAVCADEGSYLLHLSRAQYWLSEITLSLSIFCLILHLFVYSIFKELRNCPGKILMSLSSCLICGHLFLLLGPYFKNSFWMCYATAVATHFGYFSAFLWMSVMAFDIYRTFSNTKSRSTNNKTFIKYSSCSWISSGVIITASILSDYLMPSENQYRPRYGYPICWFNQRRGLIVFFILPVVILLFVNITLFSVTAFRIWNISKQTKMVSNFSDRNRYILYIKLSIVFGLTWILGILAGLLRVSVLWYPFIILNGLQGVFIFISFTVKRKIIKMLQIRFKINSDSYQIGKLSGIKKAMYSSLSNLSNLQTTMTSNLTATDDNNKMLKAVRKINPDLVMESRAT